MESATRVPGDALDETSIRTFVRAGCRQSTFAERMEMEETVRDACWLWGQEAGCYHRHRNNAWRLPGQSRMTPAEGAYYMGIPNVMVVRFNGRPEPPFRQYALPLRPLRRVVWSIVGDSSTASNDRQPDIDEVVSLGEEFPNLTGAIMDDFFIADQAHAPGRYTPEAVAGFRARLHRAARPLDLYVVLYTHDLGLPLGAHLESVDAVTFWTWNARDLADLEANFRRLEEMAPGKRKLLGLYMWDFGGATPMPLDAMEHQCRLGLQWLRAGRVEGLVFLSNCIADLELEAVEYARSFIAEVGDMSLADA